MVWEEDCDRKCVQGYLFVYEMMRVYGYTDEITSE